MSAFSYAKVQPWAYQSIKTMPLKYTNIPVQPEFLPPPEDDTAKSDGNVGTETKEADATEGGSTTETGRLICVEPL